LKPYKNKNREKNLQNFIIEIPKKEILGKCILCEKNVSDPYYSFHIEDGYIHFECAIKYIKEMAYSMRIKNFRTIYLGGKKFGIISDREKGENKKWNIIKKVDLEEIIEYKKNTNLKY